MSNIGIVSSEEAIRITGMVSKRYKKVIWHSANIVVKYSLNFIEYVDIYNSIVEGCESPDGEFVPALIDFSIRMNIISFYSNVELPEDPEKLFDVAYSSDLFEIVYKNANTKQIDAIIDSVYKFCS